METSYTTPTIGVSQNKTQLFLIIGLIVALLIGFIAVFQAIRLQNRASEVVIPVGGSCEENSATCTHDLVGLDPDKDKDLIAEIKASGKLIVRAQNDPTIIGESSYDPTTNSFVTRFTPIKGVQYVCTLEKPAGGKFELCANGNTGSVSCGPTPIISTPTPSPTNSPTPEECTDCVDGEFVCRDGATSQDIKDKYSVGGSDSCPALRLDLINYNPPVVGKCQSAVPPPTTLSCDDHIVFIESSPGFSRQLTKAECLDVKKQTPEGFLMRLHTGLAGNGCRVYEIVAYKKVTTTDPAGKEVISKGEKIRICDKCDLQIGCPAGCWAELPQSGGTTKLDETTLVDVPGIQKDDRECPANNFCNLTITGGACNSAGTETTFGITAEGDVRLYLDDQFGGTEWVDVTGKTTYTHNFKYSGYYDVVLECKNAGSPLQNFYCAQRVTKMCGGTTPPPSTPTPPSCPALTVMLDLKCPGGNCPTKTP